MAYDATKPNTAQAYSDVLASIRENFRAIVDGDSVWTVPKGGTGLTTIPAGRLLYGNGTSAISTSASLTYDGTTFNVSGSATTQTFTVSATAGDVFGIIPLGTGLGANLLGMNSAKNDYEPLQLSAETITLNLRTGSGTASAVGFFNSNISSWTSNATGLEIYGLTNYAVLRLRSPNTESMFLTSSDTANYLYGTGSIPLIFGTNNAERMRIDSSGNLLLGTSTNDLGGSSNAIFGASKSGGSSDLLIYNPSNTAGSHARIWISDGGTSAGTASLLFTSGLGGTRLAMGLDSTNSDKFKIGNGYTPGSGSTFATVDTSGNFGIGSTSPLGKFESRATSGAQIVASYDASNYGTFTASSIGTIGITSSSAASSVSAGVAIGRASYAPNNLVLHLAGESTSGYTADQAGAVIRFNGAGVAWGDLGYHPTDGSSAFHFKKAGSSYGDSGFSGIRAGTIYSMYDASNYAAFTSGSAGNLTLTLTGSAVPKAFATNGYIYSNFSLGASAGWTGTLTDFGSGAIYAMGAHVDSPDSVNLRVTGSVWGISQETAITTTADANFQIYLSNPASTYIQWRLGPLSRQNIIFHSDLNAAVSPMITAGAAVDDARHPNGTISFYIDEGANKLHFKVKYSGGAVKVGEVSLV